MTNKTVLLAQIDNAFSMREKPVPFIIDYREQYGEKHHIIQLERFDFPNEDIAERPQLEAYLGTLSPKAFAYVLPHLLRWQLNDTTHLSLFLESLFYGLSENSGFQLQLVSDLSEMEIAALQDVIKFLAGYNIEETSENAHLDREVALSASRTLQGLIRRR